MPGIADTILSQMAMAGQPRMAREVTTQMAPEQPYDISMLPLLLYLILGQQTKGPTETIGQTMPFPPRQTIGGQGVGAIPGRAPGAMAGGVPDISALINMFKLAGP